MQWHVITVYIAVSLMQNKRPHNQSERALYHQNFIRQCINSTSTIVRHAFSKNITNWLFLFPTLNNAVFWNNYTFQSKNRWSSILYYLFSVRSSKVFYVQLILIEWWQIKNIKNCNIEVNQVHQLLKTQNNQIFKNMTA